jgi:cytochrome c oxidase subunit 3
MLPVRLRVTDMVEKQVALHSPGQSEFAVRFFVTTVGLLALAGTLAWLLTLLGEAAAAQNGDLYLPFPFWISTATLAVGSWSLQRALRAVQVEKQPKFRRSLLLGLTAGTLFVAIQSYALWVLLNEHAEGEAATGATVFVFVAALLHGMHFTVALLFLVWVTLQAFADRYDHEYYWGVIVCTFFWHALGIVWLMIFGAFALIAWKV